jgi:hypothetical protein
VSHNASRPGAVFLVLFIVSVILSDDVGGSFADPESQFIGIYADSGSRAAYLASAVLLVLASLSFFWFAHTLAHEARSFRVPLLITGAAVAIGMFVAALAWATVPLSISFGVIVDDPGFESAHSVLPQFGWVALGLGAMLPAGIFIAIAARTPGLLPRWLGLTSYPIAVLVCLTAFLFMPLVLFVIWVIAVSASHRRTRPGA